MFEQRVLAAGQHFGDDLVEALLARVINLAHGASQRARHAGAGHQRVERGLARAAFHHALDVVDEDILGLRGEVEDHIHVERGEVRAGLADAREYLGAAAVLVVAVHLLEQAVVEALHTHAQALHAALQLVQVRRYQVFGFVSLETSLMENVSFARSMVSHSSSIMMVGVPPPTYRLSKS